IAARTRRARPIRPPPGAPGRPSRSRRRGSHSPGTPRARAGDEGCRPPAPSHLLYLRSQGQTAILRPRPGRRAEPPGLGEEQGPGCRGSDGLSVVLPVHIRVYICIYIETDIYIYLFFLLRAYDFQKVLKVGSAGPGPDGAFA
ncbi:hypothetical protein DBR06_SOUSAS6610126, partial [Sousa chinensis]